MNHRRKNPGVGVLNGRIYVVGGYNNGNVDLVEYYDPNTDMWTTVNVSIISNLIHK